MANFVEVDVYGCDKVVSVLRSKQAIGLRAVKQGLDAMGFVFERAMKHAASSHVDTGRYRASIGHFTASSLVKDNPEAKPSDAVWETEEGYQRITLTMGTNVYYAGKLEQLFGVLGGAYEESRVEAERQGLRIIKRALEGGI